MIRMIASTEPGKRVCAAAARLSTKSGRANDIFDSSDGGEKDENLIRKVMSSGHRSLLEHQSFSFALDEVSVFVEQCLIEFRLSSFTVKSRRYVDFKQAGYYVPENLTGEAREVYMSNMDALFDDYASLVELGVPREDARFVLPYCFYSSMYLTCNARELAYIIDSFVNGRLSCFAEIKKVGLELADAFEKAYPGVLESQRLPCRAVEPRRGVAPPTPCVAESTLVGEPRKASELLKAVMLMAGRFAPDEIGLLAKDARPRELESLTYTFLIKNVSQSCVTHFARHRIQSPIFESPTLAVNKNHYVLPESISSNEDALKIYKNAFERNTNSARKLISLGFDSSDLAYLSLSGNTLDMMITMNARELRHFFNLRSCERAQWEIRKVAGVMLDQLNASYPELFKHYGPSCLTLGACPEGRLSCGKPRR